MGSPHPIRTIQQRHHQHHRDRRDPGGNRRIGKSKRSFAESLRAFSYRRKDGMKALFTPI